MTPATSTVPLPGPSRNAVRLKLAREWHLYLGTLFAPSILFFALTGALQLFGLHESHPGETYQAPAWVQRLGSIHKNQTAAERRGPPPGFNPGQQRRPEGGQPGTLQPRSPQPGGGDARPGQADSPRPSQRRGPGIPTYALKWFFLAMSLGLSFSTLLGIYMAFKFNRSRGLVWTLLVVGTAVPVALILLTA